MAAMIMRNFHHCWHSATNTTTNTQQTGNGRNDYAEFPPHQHATTTQQHTTKKTATAATIMRNFRTVSTKKSQRDKTA